MGNRAIVKAKGNDNKAVYLHWNGGRDSIEAFLEYCKLREFRPFGDDYGMARFVQVVSNFMSGDGLSIGITDCTESVGDNGVYIVEGWDIVGREDSDEIEQTEYELSEMLLAIDEAQPKAQQLGKEYLQAELIPVADIEVGDTVLIKSHTGEVLKHEVVGFGADEYINGTNVLGMPFINLYARDGDYSKNINNYLRDDEIRIL